MVNKDNDDHSLSYLLIDFCYDSIDKYRNRIKECRAILETLDMDILTTNGIEDAQNITRVISILSEIRENIPHKFENIVYNNGL
jgi:hypothetical protein